MTKSQTVRDLSCVIAAIIEKGGLAAGAGGAAAGAQPARSNTGPIVRSTNTSAAATPRAAAQSPKALKSFSVNEFAKMTYLTENGVRQWLQQGLLKGQQDAKGNWQVEASNLEVPNVKRLVR